MLRYFILAVFVVLANATVQDPYSWPMLGGNLQRTSMSNSSSIKNGTLGWAFFQPDGDEFMNLMPVYDHINEVVWTVSYGGFIYQVDANNGSMLYEICVGIPPTFSGDPCEGVKFDEEHHGQLTMLPTSRDVFVLYMTPREGPDAMARISVKDGSIVWNIDLFNSSVDATYNSDFISLPVVIPKALNNGTTDAIILWISNKNCSNNPVNEAECLVYTIIDADTGATVLEKNYFAFSFEGFMFVPPTIDPVDGNLITTYTNDVTSSCDAAYKCEGLGKYNTMTGDVIWNTTTQNSWPYFATIHNGILQVSTSQLSAYSYYANSGKPIWKVDESTSTAEMLFPSICSDGTILMPDRGDFIQGWSPQIVRNKKPQFWSDCPYCSFILPTTNDGNFYVNADNTVSSRSCKDGSVNWELYFGDVTTYGSIAIGYEAIYVNVGKPGTGGALIKIVQNPNITMSTRNVW